MRNRKWTSAAALFGASLLVLVGSCGEDVVTPRSDEAPDTQVSATSPRSGGDGFVVDFSFSGSDGDGHVRFFEYRVLDDLTEDLPWTRTEASDLTLSFPMPSDELGFENPGPGRTLQARAVDDSGLADPTPASVSFTPLTLAPEIVLHSGYGSEYCQYASRALTFRWTATDADSKSGTPEHVRYLLKESDACFSWEQYEAGGFPILSGDEGWSDWIRYDAPLDSGRLVRFPLLPESALGTMYFFAVQARDIDGATSRAFGWWERQVAHIQIRDTPPPRLTVEEPALGSRSFWGQWPFNVEHREISRNQELEFRWTASADSVFGEVQEYRYGWDVIDPDDPNDPGWAVDWGDWTSAPARSFQLGVHNFVVEARDRTGAITRATWVLDLGEPMGAPVLAFRMYVDIGDAEEPVWQLRWSGQPDDRPYPVSPEQTELPFAGFGRRFKIEWEASSPNGPIVGYRYRVAQGSSEFWPPDVGGEKQWDPAATSFVFSNETPPADLGGGCADDTIGCDPAVVRFPSGNYDITVEAIDASQVESYPGYGYLDFAVNYPPEARIIEDASYPRFEVRDPSDQLLSMGSIARGDTIPAMSTVFFRSTGFDKFEDELPPGVPSDSLCCDTPLDYDPSLNPGDPGYVPQVEFQSRLVTVRRAGEEPIGRTLSNVFSAPEQGDTISFWAGPLDYTYESRTVDEHRRPDLSPEPFEFVAGFRPRLIENLTIPGGDVPGNPGDVADTLLVNLFQGQSWADNEIPYTVVSAVSRWWVPDPTSECRGYLWTSDGGPPPEGAYEQTGALVQVSLKFVGSSDPRDPLSPVRAWSYAIFSDKDPDNLLEDGLESRDLSFFTDSSLPNEWEFGPAQTIDIWVPFEVAFNPEAFHPTSDDALKRSIGCIVAKRLGEMTIELRGRTTGNTDEYRLYDGTRKDVGAPATYILMGEFGRQSETAELNCHFLIGGGGSGAPLFYWPDF